MRLVVRSKFKVGDLVEVTRATLTPIAPPLRRYDFQAPERSAAAHSRYSFASWRNSVAIGSSAFVALCSQSAAFFSSSAIVASGGTMWRLKDSVV